MKITEEWCTPSTQIVDCLDYAGEEAAALRAVGCKADEAYGRMAAKNASRNTDRWRVPTEPRTCRGNVAGRQTLRYHQGGDSTNLTIRAFVSRENQGLDQMIASARAGGRQAFHRRRLPRFGPRLYEILSGLPLACSRSNQIFHAPPQSRQRGDL